MFRRKVCVLMFLLMASISVCGCEAMIIGAIAGGKPELLLAPLGAAVAYEAMKPVYYGHSVDRRPVTRSVVYRGNYDYKNYKPQKLKMPEKTWGRRR